MNIKHISSLLSGLLLLFLLFSCGDNNTTTDYDSASKDARIYSFSISAIAPKSKDSVQRAQDSIRFIQVNKTKFAIDQRAGVVYNPDSLPYGTVLDMTKVTITFNPIAAPSRVLVTTPDSIKGYTWNLTDSLSFRRLPVTFNVTAADGITSKRYNIDIRTHKIDPDIILWQQMPSYPSGFDQSKTLLKGNKFYTFGLNAGTSVLYTSDRASINWAKQTLSGFAATIKLESIFLKNDIFYALDQTGNGYKSENGINWVKSNNNKPLTSILGVLPAASRLTDQLLVTYNEGGNYYFGKTTDLVTIAPVSAISYLPTDNRVPASFPLQKAASYTSITTNKSKEMLILTGGVNAAASGLTYTWLVKESADHLELSPFTKNTFFKGAGLSNFVYGDKLYVLSNNQFYISALWSESWAKAPDKQKLDPKISARTGQTVIVDESNYIWIFGGQSSNGKGVTDVWRGRLNSLIP